MNQKMMWAHRLAGPSLFEKIEVPVPDEKSLKAGEVLLRFVTGGVCGTDLPFFKGLLPSNPNPENGQSPPGAPLHEIVGEVLASQHPEIHNGALVVGWASQSVGLREYVIADGEGLFEYNAQFSPTTAIMLQPLACVISAVNRIPGIEGARAAVIGQGPIGVLFSHVLKAGGAAEVTAIDRVDRSDVATTFGVDRLVRESSDRWAAGLTAETERPNIVIEAVGHQVTTMQDAANALAMEGTLYYFGIPDDPIYPFPMRTFLRKNASLTTGLTRDRRISLSRANDYLQAHPELADAYITDEFKIDDVQSAFELAVRPAKGRLKVILSAGGAA